MNEIKFDLENKLDGAKTYREQNHKLMNSPRQFNFPLSPGNKIIKYVNLENINTEQISKYISKKFNSTNKKLSENIKKIYQQQSANNIIKNQINPKIKELYNERVFQKGVLDEKLESILFTNKLKSKNNINKLLNPNQKIFNNISNTNSRLKLNNEYKINLNSFIEHKHQPLINKFKNKRSTSVINANKANEKIKEMNNLTYKECLFMTKNNNENEKVKMGKTPNKKIFIKSNEKKNINNKSNFNIIDVNNIQKNKNKKIIELEENHFKAVLYTQEIKKLKKNLN
jgi:hypothetical protein